MTTAKLLELLRVVNLKEEVQKNIANEFDRRNEF